MTDRFKFRIWNSNKNKYVYFDFNDLSEYGADEVEEISNSLDCLDLGLSEQCTGLKDKNDNLVYEGDILIDKYSCIVEIVYQKNCMFQALQKNGIKGAEFYTSYSLEPEYIKNSEIIGNIHENKDLLK